MGLEDLLIIPHYRLFSVRFRRGLVLYAYHILMNIVNCALDKFLSSGYNKGNMSRFSIFYAYCLNTILCCSSNRTDYA